ncbi:MAG: rhodanese-like domain-containing protein [Salinivirgaceae bacterium]|jgi:rhodanese-related sulfurtransferase|nr:rhodanese-like domain-containing protein [Salinivirgaceae bacterium]
MKKVLYGMLIIVVFASCQSQQQSNTEQQQEVDQFAAVMNYLESTGDYINSSQAPSIIAASKVYSLLGSGTLVIDIRDKAQYQSGHIPGAVNVSFAELIFFFEKNIDPASFNNIILACYSGQSAGFAASLLRMLGYNNVFSLKWGMSSWNKEMADLKWNKKISSKYVDQLEIDNNPKNEFGEYPKIMSADTLAYAIVRERALEMLKNGFKHYSVNADVLFEQPTSFYIINYWPENLYNKGHIPTAIQYAPKKSLSRTAFLQTLPADKTVVPYCYTGQHSAYVTAYLVMIGYDAKSLLYGANGFMHQVLIDDIGHGFSDKQYMDYPMSTDQGQTVPNPKKNESKSTITVPGGC